MFKNENENKKINYLDFSLVEDVEVVALVALLDDDLARVSVDGEHGVEDVRTFVLVQMREQHILGDGFR